MYKIDFYRDKDGKSELQEYIDSLWNASPKSKDAHVQYEQISLQIKLLQEKGTNLPSKYTKHLYGRYLGIASGQKQDIIEKRRKITSFSYGDIRRNRI